MHNTSRVLTCLFALICTCDVAATAIAFQLRNVAAITWEYSYTLENDSLAVPIEELTLFFDQNLYANLASPSVPNGWDAEIAQPDPSLGDRGFFDVVAAAGSALAPGASQSGFSIQFDFLGTGTPGAQAFDIVDPDTFALVDTGMTVGTPPGLAAAVLPGSRSVQVMTQASAFATIINTGAQTATGCSISPATTVPATFTYQTTNALNEPIGLPDTPVDIEGANGSQTFLFAFTPTAAFAPTEIALSFDCANSEPAPSFVGLSTLLLAASDSPVPDVVALAVTPSNDGIVNIPGTTGIGFFVVATVNVGAGDTISASADTGSANLPVSITLCQTDPLTSLCINPAAGPTPDPVDVIIGAGETPTFAIFATGSGDVAFDPANSRVFVSFRDGNGVVRGSTSVAVRTQVP